MSPSATFSIPTNTIGLYGGAVTASFPAGFIDASQFREVPDTQEVYVSQEVDDSVVVDLLEAVPETGDGAVAVHLQEIADINSAGKEFERVYSESVDVPSHKTSGTLTVAVEPARKWGRETALSSEEGSSDANDLLAEPMLVLVMAVIRLESVQTDVVVTFNTPVTQRSDLDKVKAGQPEDMPARVRFGVAAVRQLADTFTVQDWSLFG